MTKPGRPRQSEGRDLPCNGGGIWCEVAHPGRSHLGCPLAPFTAAAPPPLQGPSVLPVLALTPPELPCLVPGNWPLLPRLCHCDRISLSPLPVSTAGWGAMTSGCQSSFGLQAALRITMETKATPSPMMRRLRSWYTQGLPEKCQHNLSGVPSLRL